MMTRFKYTTSLTAIEYPTSSSTTTPLTIKYTSSTGSTSGDYVIYDDLTYYNKYNISCNEYIDEYGLFMPKVHLSIKNVSDSPLISLVEDEIERYIWDSFDRYSVQEYGRYIYQVIQEKAYEIAGEVIKKANEEYDIEDEENYTEALLEEIDFSALYDIVDDMLDAPITMEERLSEIGMSYMDFL